MMQQMLGLMASSAAAGPTLLLDVDMTNFRAYEYDPGPPANYYGYSGGGSGTYYTGSNLTFYATDDQDSYRLLFNHNSTDFAGTPSFVMASIDNTTHMLRLKRTAAGQYKVMGDYYLLPTQSNHRIRVWEDTRSTGINTLIDSSLTHTGSVGTVYATVGLFKSGYINMYGAGPTTGFTGDHWAAQNWYISSDPTVAATTHYVRATVTAGALTSGTTGTWLATSTDREWSCYKSTAGTASATVKLEIATDSGGTNIVATGYFDLSATRT